jgi:RNA polymerase sigma factor (sigma-70 family)
MNAVCEPHILIERAHSGDETAIGELLRRFEADVRLAARMALGPLLRAHVDSMDLVQSAYVHILTALRENRFSVDLADPDRLRLFLTFAVRNRAAVHVKTSQRRGALLARAIAQGRRSAPEAAPGDHARAAERADLLEYILGFMKPQDRRAVELRAEGYSTTEAARVLGMDADLLRVQLNRMRSRLPPGCEQLADVF